MFQVVGAFALGANGGGVAPSASLQVLGAHPASTPSGQVIPGLAVEADAAVLALEAAGGAGQTLVLGGGGGRGQKVPAVALNAPIAVGGQAEFAVGVWTCHAGAVDRGDEVATRALQAG